MKAKDDVNVAVQRSVGVATDAGALLPCPFCGNTRPVLHKIDRHEGLTHHDYWQVSCALSSEDPGCPAQLSFSDAASAARSWNRRVIYMNGTPISAPAISTNTTESPRDVANLGG